MSILLDLTATDIRFMGSETELLTWRWTKLIVLVGGEI